MGSAEGRVTRAPQRTKRAFWPGSPLRMPPRLPPLPAALYSCGGVIRARRLAAYPLSEHRGAANAAEGPNGQNTWNYGGFSQGAGGRLGGHIERSGHPLTHGHHRGTMSSGRLRRGWLELSGRVQKSEAHLKFKHGLDTLVPWCRVQWRTSPSGN